MNVLLYPFMLLSALGLVLSIGSHLAALTGLPIPGGNLVLGLHIGILSSMGTQRSNPSINRNASGLQQPVISNVAALKHEQRNIRCRGRSLAIQICN